ncbi:MFS transporter [Protofrankia symbiont of Coriaria ruscifolia]|uniref:MFS transporter n=1 Tax=Protofrankia symbiont of Coriaria ruscifolia TaxID=1306542 RepID=UPI00104190CC|nr:MFS transporter [Protofrankia symbiont of Coriaria ruscifolia]
MPEQEPSPWALSAVEPVADADLDRQGQRDHDSFALGVREPIGEARAEQAPGPLGADPSDDRVRGPAGGAGQQLRPIGEDGESEQLRRWRAERRAAHALTADPRWARPDGDGRPDAGGTDTSDAAAVPPSVPPPASQRVPWPAGTAADEPSRGEPGGTRPDFLWGAPIGAHTGDADGGPAGSAAGSAGPAGTADRPARPLGGLLVLIAGAMTIVGSAMPWATITAFDLVEIPLRGTEAGQYYGGATALLGVLSVVLGGLLIGRDRSGWRWIVTAVTGMAIALIAVIDMVRLLGANQLGGIELNLSVELGPGLWITLLGGLVVAAGAVLARFTPHWTRRSTRRARQDTQDE